MRDDWVIHVFDTHGPAHSEQLFRSVLAAGCAEPERVRLLWHEKMASMLEALARSQPAGIVLIGRASDPMLSMAAARIAHMLIAPTLALTHGSSPAEVSALLAAGVDLHMDVRMDARLLMPYLALIFGLPMKSPHAPTLRWGGAARRSVRVVDAAFAAGAPCAAITIGDLMIDTARRVVTRSGAEVSLSRKEFALLTALSRKPDHVQTHRELYTAVWGDQIGDETKYLRVYIRSLRIKLERDPASPQLIQTVSRRGYRLASGLEATG